MSARDTSQRWEEHLTGGATPSAKRRGAALYPFGEEGNWAVGHFLARPDSVPRPLYPFFFFFFFYLFLLFSFLFVTFSKQLKTTSNQYLKSKTMF
jgi:hypothetical protein